MAASVLEFFNLISTQYDDLVSRSIPRYREMFWAMLYYLPAEFAPKRILELGCGTGNLTRLLHQQWPQSAITVVDISDEMLQKTASKLADADLTTIQSSFEALELTDGQFDLVISSIAVHHIADTDKAALIRRIYGWLRPSGFFVLGDQVRSANERLYQADINYYESYAQEQGASAEDIAQWREHRNDFDKYATVSDLLGWMQDAGFRGAELLWRYCFWVVFQGQK